MAFFHIVMHGENFLIAKDGKEAFMSFFKNVYVEASSSDDAEDYAIQRVVSDPAFRVMVKNPPDKPPALSIAETNPMEKDPTLVDSEFIFFADPA